MKSLFAIFLLSLFIACSTGDDSTLPPGNSIEGNWAVHLFTDGGQNKTSNYSGYVFGFNGNGSVTATKAMDITPGTWSKTSNKLSLHWTGGGIPVVLLEIEEDWVITSNNNSLMVLTDTVGNGGKVKELHFQRQ